MSVANIPMQFVEGAKELYGGTVPARSTGGSAAFDLRHCGIQINDPGVNGAGEPVLFRLPTGIRCAIPTGYCGLVLPRSGLAARGWVVHPGLIDSDYRGEINVVARPNGPVRRGDRIAQLLVMPFVAANMIESIDLGTTYRGEGGFGSTGVE